MVGFVVVVLVLVGAVAVAAARPPAPADAGATPSSRLAAVHRRTRRWRWGGLGLGLVVGGAALAVDDPLGRGVLLAAPLGALCVLGGVVVGELRVAAPGGPTRQGHLEVRRARAYLPPRLAPVVATAAVVLAAVLVAASAVGSPDDLGNAGRRVVQRCSDAVTVARGPWPGSYDGVPLAVVVAVGLAAAAVALRRVVRRPRQGEDLEVDDALRRQAAAAVTAAAGLLVAVPLAGVAAVAGIALVGLGCGPGWIAPLGTAALVVAPAALVLAGWCAAVLVSPRAHPAPAAVGRR